MRWGRTNIARRRSFPTSAGPAGPHDYNGIRREILTNFSNGRARFLPSRILFKDPDRRNPRFELSSIILRIFSHRCFLLRRFFEVDVCWSSPVDEVVELTVDPAFVAASAVDVDDVAGSTLPVAVTP